MGGAGGGLAGQVRAVYLFGRTPGDSDDGRLLAQAKRNLAAARPSLRFELDVRNLGAGIAAPLLRYTGSSQLDAQTLLDPAEPHQPTSQTEAAAWLVNYLFAAGPPHQRSQAEIEETPNNTASQQPHCAAPPTPGRSAPQLPQGHHRPRPAPTGIGVGIGRGR